ncbi:MAG TPA: RtcB family protein [Thermoanaerobaculia bacterium]|jgi:tRNA-splicing ligase RtcB|nr:RtcB family protein [Thermoanaerobaculia bacterium]HPA50978.1 RtcB family protein [Thermoanaerobaculia bacterium]HQN06298.1 RtcB family protein [Thermoanaerobaculia bacterium]HQP86614.1 RtcB family protein [Thermoanaerobaculia bacterium]
MTDRNFDVIDIPGGVPVKSWTRGVPFEPEAKKQLANIARLPFIHKWVAAMPDVHLGIGATVGSVVPTVGAIIPAAVGVDIGCGMMALKTDLAARDLPDDLHPVRTAIERAVPHGRTDNGGRNDRGAWAEPPDAVAEAWAPLAPRLEALVEKHPAIRKANHVNHLATLGTGNHFIEVCLDEDECVWLMLHSGSRGVGNRIGSYFIELAKEDMRRHFINLPDADLAYLPEGTKHFDDYVAAVGWAQEYAMTNRRLMMANVVAALGALPGLPPFTAGLVAVNCHHNYVEREHHYGKNVFVTRKGAVRARKGDLGVIPGSMGTRSYIVSGLGNPESFHSCSHGAGRSMSRAEARRRFTVADHAKATEGIECRKDEDVIDETPAAYKPIDAVMEAQRDLVEVLHTLRQVVCVKG